jgi:uncharacterized glyoxalase superfamily protein PhnB
LKRAKLDNAAAVFITPDVRRTAVYYGETFGFTVVEHFDAEEPFAAIYRDSVEILLVQAKRGEFQPNTVRYGAGFDIYLDPDSVEGVDSMFAELTAAGARIVREPAMTPYGTYELVVEDVDGRLIGIGRIRERETFFRGAFD